MLKTGFSTGTKAIKDFCCWLQADIPESNPPPGLTLFGGILFGGAGLWANRRSTIKDCELTELINKGEMTIFKANNKQNLENIELQCQLWDNFVNAVRRHDVKSMKFSGSVSPSF